MDEETAEALGKSTGPLDVKALLRRAQVDTVVDAVHLLENLKRLLPMGHDKEVDDMANRLRNMARTL